MGEKNLKEVIELIQDIVDDLGLPKYSALRKRAKNLIENLEIPIKDEDGLELKTRENDFSANLFNMEPLIKKGNKYKLNDYQFNVILLVLILEYTPETEGLLYELKDKKTFIDNKNRRIEKMYNDGEDLEKIKRETFNLYKLMEEYSDIVSKIKEYDYERLKKYESKLDSTRTGQIINQYKDYIGFMTMGSEKKSYLSRIFEHVSSYTPEIAEEIIDELKDEELNKNTIKKKLMEVELTHSKRAETKNHKLIEIVEDLELDDNYND